MHRNYVAADDLLLDSFQLARNIFESGFKPDFLVGLWRGGSAVGIAVQEGLEYFGVDTDHIAIRTSYQGQPSYSEMVDRAEAIRAHGLRYLHERVSAHHSMLIVDDVYSTGSSVNAVVAQLNRILEMELATVVYYTHYAFMVYGHARIPIRGWFNDQATESLTIRPPDFYVHETADWLILPYELCGLSIEELRANKTEIRPVIDRLEALVRARGKKSAAPA